MSPRTLAIAIALLGSAIASHAHGDGLLSGRSGSPPADGLLSGRSVSPPADVKFAFLEAPPPAPAPAPPPPAREGDEYPRKSWEIFPEAGFGAPFCRGDALGASHCADNGNGSVFGGGALYRLTPYVALGAIVSFANFHLDPSRGPGAYSRASFMGFLARGYFADRGAIDPYVETGAGRGDVVMGRADDAGDVRSNGAGLSLLAGAGIDFWLMPYLKIGPALSYRFTWLTDVRTCDARACATAPVADRGAVGSYASLSFVATLALGHEM